MQCNIIMTRFNITAALLLLSLFVTGCSSSPEVGCLEPVRCEVSGIVVNESGTPISGILVVHDMTQENPQADVRIVESCVDGSFNASQFYYYLPKTHVITLCFIDPRWFDGVSEESYAPAKVRVNLVHDFDSDKRHIYVEEEPLTVVMSETGDEETEEEDYRRYLKIAGRQ